MARVVSRTFLLFLPTAVFVLTLHRDTVDIDLHSGVVRGYSRYVTFVEPPSHERRERCARQAVVRIDFSGPYKIAKFLLEYDRPRLWTLHIADSHGSDGHGGDNVNATSNMAALHVFNRQMRIYSNSLPGYLGATIDGGLLLKVVDNIARRGSKLQLQVSNEKLEWTQGKQREVLESRFLFTLSGQQPVFGTVDYDLFASFNRIIAGNWRNGSGLCRATIVMLREEDECILGTHECDTNAICRNTKKSYRCTCKTGYEGDGKRCEDKDECKVRNGGCVHRCHNSPGNYSCSCYEGFHLDKDGHNCIDVNECLVSKGGCAHHCVNTMGSYECRCNEGYNIGSDGRSCVVGSWCREQGCGHTCELTRSSYICTCRPGYILTKDGKNCMQTCSLGNGGCQHRCTNTPDGPVCTCHYKYILGLDKKSCSPSCSVNNGGCDRRCSTTPQGAVKCSCPNGFIIHKDGRTCLDIDECETKNGGCSYKCQNNIGSYECICPKGFKLLPDEKTCTEFDECSINGTCDHICINLPGSYECQCHQGYERYGLTHCGDKNECTVNNGGCSHICENTPGSFRCLCPEGFHLHLNKRDCIESDPCRDSTARIQLKCTWNNSQEHCGATCNSNGYLTKNGNESYSFTCGSHNYGSGRGLCTETGVGAPCFEATDSPAIRRQIRFYFMTEKCNLIKKNFLSISTAFRKNACLSLGHITYIKIECAPYQRHRYHRDTISTTPIPKPDPSSVIKLELDLQVDYERSTDKCDYQCVRRKGERKLKQVINHVRLIISNEKFFFVSDGSLYEITRWTQKHPVNQTFCNDDQFFIHEKCVTCSLGSYYNMEHARCLPCPSGTYQDEDGQLGCNICPLDRSWSNRDVMGAKNISQCGAQCNPGSFSSDGFEPCTPCMKGTFQPESGRTSCIPCGRGVNTKTTGASSFRDCLVKDSCSSGYFFDTSLAQCVVCPRGTYQSLMGQNFCVNCPGNTTTDFEGAKDVSECKSIDCGGYVGKLLGIFESPNFPGNYPNNIECTWVIHPEKGRRILVVVPEVYLANDKCGDYMVMRKSRSPYSVTTYETCKTQDRPIAFTARSRKLWIQFKADSKNNARGFRIPYALFNEEYQPLIESIVRDSQLYAMINHQEILKDRKLLTALMDVIAHPINYYKYANISRAWFPDSFIRFIMSKVKIFFS